MRVLILAILLLALPAQAAPKAELWPRWTVHDPSSTLEIDHSAWGRFLRAYVSRDAAGIARVGYGRVTPADRALLQGYISAMQSADIDRFARPEQRAFWINLYNALTVETVLAHYPVASIREIRISPGLFASGPWGRKLARVAGEALSLDDIEHRILRPIWRDPRIHYALNCASLGCPDLAAEPYLSARAEAQLDAAAFDFVNHPRGVSLEDGRLRVSSIYDWFREDFGGDDAGVLAHLVRHAAPDLRARLGGIARVSAHFYDWRLNDAGQSTANSSAFR
ncbi:MAG: DUF547 domain-containing protein [Rhodospirillales bacterium]|nr:DUF547 domain-containing protein [Rhodospirillales bacterium]